MSFGLLQGRSRLQDPRIDAMRAVFGGVDVAEDARTPSERDEDGIARSSVILRMRDSVFSGAAAAIAAGLEVETAPAARIFVHHIGLLDPAGEVIEQ